MLSKRYIKLILPLRLEWEPYYYLTGDACIGQRVIVKFAGRRIVGVISDTDVIPDIVPSKIQPVISGDSGLDPISPQEIELWRFIADYYLCTVGEVYLAAYPLSKTASEESKVQSQQRKQALEARTEDLWRKRIARLQERLDANSANLAKKHKDTVRARLENQRLGIVQNLQEAESRLAALSHSLEIENEDYSALLSGVPDSKPDPILQQALGSGKPVLLKSADRNTNYIQTAAQTLRNGKNICILVNEIALAGPLRNNLRSVFGDLLLVHHSKMTSGARRRIMDAVRSGMPYILIGSRSALFLPHRDLGLIIVENEESALYKQSDPAPRYNARDCAVQLARIHGCSVILGSGSPSLESILNARSGRYTLVDCNPQGQQLHQSCRYSLIDISSEWKKNGMNGLLSRKLQDAMSHSNKTVLIRGFEKPEDLEGLDADILTIPQAAKTDLSGYDLTAVLNADALFNPADFRSDEHAFQYLERLRSICPQLIVQTRQAAHQVFSLKSAEPLLEERRKFNLPPYTRIIDIRTSKSEALGRNLSKEGFSPIVLPDYVRVSLTRDKTLLEQKRKLRKTLEAFRSSSKTDVITDVDPV